MRRWVCSAMKCYCKLNVGAIGAVEDVKVGRKLPLIMFSSNNYV